MGLLPELGLLPFDDGGGNGARNVPSVLMSARPDFWQIVDKLLCKRNSGKGKSQNSRVFAEFPDDGDGVCGVHASILARRQRRHFIFG